MKYILRENYKEERVLEYIKGGHQRGGVKFVKNGSSSMGTFP